MSRLIPLHKIPDAARAIEREARRQYRGRNLALEAAAVRIVVAEGFHSAPPGDPPVVGWVLTPQAGEAIVRNSVIHMPGGTHQFCVRAERVDQE